MVCGTQVMYVMKEFRSIHIYTRLFNLVARLNPNRMEEDVYTLPRFQKCYSTKSKTKIMFHYLISGLWFRYRTDSCWSKRLLNRSSKFNTEFGWRHWWYQESKAPTKISNHHQPKTCTRCYFRPFPLWYLTLAISW